MSQENQKKYYRERIINSWRAFDEYDAKSVHTVYRGQANAEWSLITGYEREQGVQNPMRELPMIQNFCSQAGLYISDLPARTDYVSWLSIMQHYGAGTRLFDVTRSRYIALFFAVVGMIEHNKYCRKENEWNCAVWAFKTDAPNRNLYNWLLVDEDTGCIDIRAAPYAVPLEEYKEYGWRFANQFIISDAQDECVVKDDGVIYPHCNKMVSFRKTGGIIELIPQKRNKRMVAQAAEFLMPITLRKSFEDNLCAWSNLFQEEEVYNIEKLVISKDLGTKCYQKLCEMNINYHTLFSDITGLAKQVNCI